MKPRRILMICLTAAALLLNACSGDTKEEAKSMEQIQQAEGIPVTFEPVAQSSFVSELSYFSKLSGVKQSTRGALIGGKIEKINAKVGDAVTKGQIIVEFPQTEPASAYVQAKSAYEDSKRNYERMKELYNIGETSKANYEGMETKYLVDKRNYEAQKQLLFVESQFDGVITEIMVKEGDNVKGETALFTVAQVDGMRAKMYASTQEVAMIKKGMTAVIEDNGKKYYGRIIEVALSVDPYKQSFAVEAEFRNPGRELKAGAVYEIKINVYENGKAIVVPRNLVKQDGGGYFTFVENNGIAVKKYIQIGKENGINYEVKSGLSIGDRLIVKGAGQVADGSKVKPVQ